MSTEVRSLAVYDRIADPMAAIATLGRDIAHSQMFGCSNEEQGRVLALTCFARRTDPLTLAESYHLIQNRLSMKADKMLSNLHERGGRHRIIQRTSESAEIEITYDGDTQRFSFMWADAQQEPFVYGKEKNGKRSLKDNWATPRGRMQMLWARVVSDGVRAMCPEAVCGCYVPEEIDDSTLADSSDGEETESVVLDAVVTTEKATAVETAVETAAATSVTTSTTSTEDNYATGEQVQRIIELYSALQVPVEAQETAMKKRGVNALRSLTRDQAEEILVKLKAKADASRADQTAFKATDSDPASQTQIDQAKQLIREIAQNGQADIADRVKKKLSESGLSKLADLSMVEIDRLNKALAVRNLEAFFGSVIQGHRKN